MMYNHELELTLLANILKDGDESEVLDKMRPLDFTDEVCQKTFSACRKLVDKGKKIDIISINGIDKDIDPIFLSELTDYFFVVNDIRQAINELKLFSKRRSVCRKAEQLRQACVNGDDVAMETLASKITEEADEEEGGEAKLLVEFIDDTVKESLIEFDDPTHISGVRTGFDDFDYLANGLDGLITIAARPSQGKTTFVTNIMEQVSNRMNVLMFSLETPKEDIVKRMIRRKEELSYDDYRMSYADYIKGNFSEENFEKLKDAYKQDRFQAAGEIAKKLIYIDDTPGVNIEYIRKKSIKYSKRLTGGVGLIVIDHIGKIIGNKGTPRENVMHITKTLQILQRELGIPIVMLSQLNRAVELRNDKMPILADLKESGTIEEDSDQIIFMYRPYRYDPDEDKTEARFSVAKNRNGRTGQFRLRCHMDKFDFRRWEE